MDSAIYHLQLTSNHHRLPKQTNKQREFKYCTRLKILLKIKNFVMIFHMDRYQVFVTSFWYIFVVYQNLLQKNYIIFMIHLRFQESALPFWIEKPVVIVTIKPNWVFATNIFHLIVHELKSLVVHQYLQSLHHFLV